MEIFDQLTAEQDRLEGILSDLTEDVWLADSGAAGWTIADVVLHLAQTEEAVVTVVDAAASGGPAFDRVINSGSVDEVMDDLVRAERTTPAEIFRRWSSARRASVAALRRADPSRPLTWVAAALKPRTLATTRLAEHWAHGLDITAPFGISFPDTDRLRQVAWLAHSSLRYAFAMVGQQPQDVFCELTGPDGAVWQYGPATAESSISGSAGEFCRVAARRLAPDDSALVATGPHGATALRILRTYAA